MTTTLKSLMDLRHYLRSPFAEDNGVLAMLKSQKEWEKALDELMKENDRLRAVLREYREADDDIINMSVLTKAAFERLHAAEAAADEILNRNRKMEEE